MASSNTHNLTIGHCNIQGGLTGISKSTQVLQLLGKYNLDILSLNETNLNNTIDTNTLNIPPNYIFLRTDRGTGVRDTRGLRLPYKLKMCI